WANPALRKLLKIPMELELTRLNARDFYVRPEDRDRLLEKLKEKRELLDYEVELKDFQGRRLWVSFNLKLIEEDGQYFLWGILQDITPRKRAEQSLAERGALFRALAENAPLAVILMDEEGKIIYFNPAAEKIFGYRAEEVLGKDLHLTLSSPKHHETYLRSFQRLRSTGKSRLAGKRREFEGRRKDGTCFPVEVFFSTIELPDKRCYLGLIQDISERKRIEEERLQLEKHRAMELLAGGIAHDFNNLLTSLIGHLELAERLIEEPGVREILRRAEKAAQNAKDLARKLLIFSKGDIPVPKEVDLKSVVEDLARFILRGSPVKLHHHLLHPYL
ncbi:MAG TPA: PAS domain S-box protein, partial [Aquificaceae bacterium]|nr:PAS domain S-box protein [Aquificaceae bacterium]